MRIGFERDVPASRQLDGWENGTFQKCGGGTHAYTVQTHVIVPHTVDEQGQDAVCSYIEAAIRRGEADFTIIVGQDDRPEDER